MYRRGRLWCYGTLVLIKAGPFELPSVGNSQRGSAFGFHERLNPLDMFQWKYRVISIMNKEVSIQIKLPNGSYEQGVGYDICCRFYRKCTVGANVKTPYLRQEYQTHEWQAIGRIAVKGWLAAEYFPIHLPLPFLEEALYGVTYSSIR
ncbi:hypothetical protein NHX12_006725 [Muraenolepis orangiensis]|uniref:Uncharacterized protein n=1 Tax=Muraenolepis orangiensis TaxID=630683 RepID=A0A9Q0DNN7_9TELE|nr:hypothetical protein NHX12_006725 [Muraenolepis orangiensis]